MAEKKYTLTQKRSVRGPVEDGKAAYVYEKGDIIDQKKFNALTKRHKQQFEEGAIDLMAKSTPKAAEQDSVIADLTQRVADLELAVNGLMGEKEEAVEPAKK